MGYPFPLPTGVSQIANFDRHTNRGSEIDCKVYYLDCVKNYVYRAGRDHGVDEATLKEAKAQFEGLGVTAFARLLGFPRFDLAVGDPLLVLAGLPFQDLPDYQPLHLSGGGTAQGRQGSLYQDLPLARPDRRAGEGSLAD